MSHPLEPSLVRIYQPSGKICGAGFLVAPRYVLTCAHVITRALDLSDNTPDLPENQIELDFPFVYPSRTLEARVSYWNINEDLAGLEILGEIPEEAKSAPLLPGKKLWKHSFSAFGFPNKYNDGVWADGEILETTAIGWLQVVDKKQTGYFIAPGFSGGPVWDDDLFGVVGMIIAVDVNPEKRVAYIIPMHHLMHIWDLLQPPRPLDLVGVLDRQPVGFAAGLKNFLLEYLGTPDDPVPFGGRKAQLLELDQWFQGEDSSPYALLEAEAGRGKSAILVHWAHSLLLRKMARVIFLPVSLRFNTASPSSLFKAMAACLSDIHYEKNNIELLAPADQWRDLCRQYLERELPDDRPVILIIDALDELAGTSRYFPALFPTKLPKGLKILVSARILGRNTVQGSWADTLELPSERLKRFELPLLDRVALQEILLEMGEPIAKLEKRPEIVYELFRLTEGDPLLIRLYIDKFRRIDNNFFELRPDELPLIKKGLDGYFERWWRDQRDQWISQNRDPIREEKYVRNFIHVCSLALGPLTRSDVAGIIGDDYIDGLFFDEIINAIGRFIIGDGQQQGFVFSHSRLRQFFLEKMETSERGIWQNHFINYGKKLIQASKEGRLDSRDFSKYILNNFSAHLTQALLPPEDTYELMNRTWLNVWEAQGSYDGFLNDVELAWQLAKKQGPVALGYQLRALLIFSSLVSMSSSAPSDLIRECIIAGVMSPNLGLLLVQRNPDEKSRVEGITKIKEFLPSTEQNQLVEQSLALARSIQNPENRGLALAFVATTLPVDQRGIIVNEAINSTQQIVWDESDQHARASALIKILEILSLEDNKNLIEKVWSNAISDIEDESSWVWYIEYVVSKMDLIQLRKVLNPVHSMYFEENKIRSLAFLSDHLSHSEKSPLLEDALSHAETMLNKRRRLDYNKCLSLLMLAERIPRLKDRFTGEVIESSRNSSLPIRDRVRILAAVSSFLPDHEKERLLLNSVELAFTETAIPDQALALRKVLEKSNEAVFETVLKTLHTRLGEYESWVYYIRDLLIVFAQHAPQYLLEEVIICANSITDISIRFEVIHPLLSRLPNERRSVLLRETLRDSRLIRDFKSKSLAICNLAKYLKENEQGRLVDHVYRDAKSIKYPLDRAFVLSNLSKLSSPIKATLLMEMQKAAYLYRDGCHPSLKVQLKTDQKIWDQINYWEKQHKKWDILGGRLDVLKPWLGNKLQGVLVDGYSDTEVDGLYDLVLDLLKARTGLELNDVFLKLMLTCSKRGSVELLEQILIYWQKIIWSTSEDEFEKLSFLLKAFSIADRDKVLGLIQVLASKIFEIGGEKAIKETVQSVIDVGEWWS